MAIPADNVAVLAPMTSMRPLSDITDGSSVVDGVEAQFSNRNKWLITDAGRSIGKVRLRLLSLTRYRYLKGSYNLETLEVDWTKDVIGGYAQK